MMPKEQPSTVGTREQVLAIEDPDVAAAFAVDAVAFAELAARHAEVRRAVVYGPGGQVDAERRREEAILVAPPVLGLAGPVARVAAQREAADARRRETEERFRQREIDEKVREGVDAAAREAAQAQRREIEEKVRAAL